MALLAIEGFDGGGTIDADLITYLQRRYTATNLVSKHNNVTGRFSGRALEIWGDEYFNIAIANKQTSIIGFAFKARDFITTDAIIQFKDGATIHGELQTVAGGELRVTRSTNITLGITSGLALLADTWYYIELKITIDNAVGAFELRVGNVNVLSDTAIDTQNGGNAYIDAFSIFGDPGSADDSLFFDDIYIADTTGSVNNDFLGNHKITMVSPDALGSSANFTPSAGANFENIDDGITVDDDTTYNESATAAHKDLVNYSAAADLGVIAGVQIATECRETDANSFTLKTVVKSGGTESDDSAQNMGSTYTALKRVVELDPNTSAPWTLINLNAAEFGYKVG